MMKKITLKIEGMTCSACSIGLEKYLNKQDGIIDAVVNLVLQEAVIQYEDNLEVNDLERFVKEVGFLSLGEAKKLDIVSRKKEERKLLIIFSVLAVFVFLGSMINMFFDKFVIGHYIILFLFSILFLWYGRDILKNGFKNLKYKTPNMDTLISIGVMASFIYSMVQFVFLLLGNINFQYLYFDSVVMVIFFVKLGRYIDFSSKTKTVCDISDLVKMTPEVALKKVDDQELKITIDEIRKGDILVVKPGMKIAVDGVIVKGSSHLDEAFITGESVPVKKEKGDLVIAGSMNYDGVLEYRAEKIGRNSTISEIVHLVVDASNTKAPVAKLSDKICSYFVPVILLISLFTFLGYFILDYSFSVAILSMVNVLVVACPCALGLATPLAMVIGIGKCAKKGILVKSSEILEIVNRVDTIVFDKTGTLTYGNLEIDEVVYEPSYSKKKILQIVASIEQNSTHPIAGAFLRYAKRERIKMVEVKDFENIEGIGVSAKIDNKTFYLGNHKLFSKLSLDNPYRLKEKKMRKNGDSIVYVIQDQRVIALIGVKDKIREKTKEVIFSLKEYGKEVVMLTGDHEEVACRIGYSVGIERIYSDVLPVQKREIIKELQKNGKRVMMLGDGMNDAPALAIADVGVSVHGATDIANNSADVILLKNDLTSVINLVIISKKTLKNIRENLFWAFFYNSCMIPIAIGFFRPFGIEITPVIASFAMMLSSLTVVWNALRLRK